MPSTGSPWPPCWCKVCSMKPSPPSAQITSASPTSCCSCVAVSSSSACRASGVPLDTKAMRGSAGRFMPADYDILVGAGAGSGDVGQATHGDGERREVHRAQVAHVLEHVQRVLQRRVVA